MDRKSHLPLQRWDFLILFDSPRRGVSLKRPYGGAEVLRQPDTGL